MRNSAQVMEACTLLMSEQGGMVTLTREMGKGWSASIQWGRAKSGFAKAAYGVGAHPAEAMNMMLDNAEDS